MSTASLRPTRLSEAEVRDRLNLCGDNQQVVDELYEFGKALGSEVTDRIRAVESKAISFAAYGAALVTLLVSSASLWSKVGNQWPSWISVCAGFCGLMCTVFSLRVLMLREYEWTSEDEWLRPECLTEINILKRYRILTMWGIVHSHGRVQSEKARELQRAEVWLEGAVIFLLYLLLQIAIILSPDNGFWVPLWQRVIQGHLGISVWQNYYGWARALILGLTWVLIGWRVWRVRLI